MFRKYPIWIAVIAISVFFTFKVLRPFSLDVAVASNFHVYLYRKEARNVLNIMTMALILVVLKITISAAETRRTEAI